MQWVHRRNLSSARCGISWQLRTRKNVKIDRVGVVSECRVTVLSSVCQKPQFGNNLRLNDEWLLWFGLGRPAANSTNRADTLCSDGYNTTLEWGILLGKKTACMWNTVLPFQQTTNLSKNVPTSWASEGEGAYWNRRPERQRSSVTRSVSQLSKWCVWKTGTKYISRVFLHFLKPLSIR